MKTEGRTKGGNPGGFIRGFKGPVAGETREPKKHPRAHRCTWEARGQDKAGIYIRRRSGRGILIQANRRLDKMVHSYSQNRR